MNNSIKHITSLFFIFLFSLNGIISVCPPILAKLATIVNIELIIHAETNESEKNAEGKIETVVKELFLKNAIDYDFENTHYTVTEKSIADNNLARKQDVVFSVIIPPPKIMKV